MLGPVHQSKRYISLDRAILLLTIGLTFLLWRNWDWRRRSVSSTSRANVVLSNFNAMFALCSPFFCYPSCMLIIKLRFNQDANWPEYRALSSKGVGAEWTLCSVFNYHEHVVLTHWCKYMAIVALEATFPGVRRQGYHHVYTDGFLPDATFVFVANEL